MRRAGPYLKALVLILGAPFYGLLLGGIVTMRVWVYVARGLKGLK